MFEMLPSQHFWALPVRASSGSYCSAARCSYSGALMRCWDDNSNHFCFQANNYLFILTNQNPFACSDRPTPPRDKANNGQADKRCKPPIRIEINEALVTWAGASRRIVADLAPSKTITNKRSKLDSTRSPRGSFKQDSALKLHDSMSRNNPPEEINMSVTSH